MTAVESHSKNGKRKKIIGCVLIFLGLVGYFILVPCLCIPRDASQDFWIWHNAKTIASYLSLGVSLVGLVILILGFIIKDD